MTNAITITVHPIIYTAETGIYTSAARMPLPNKWRQIIREQPGYRKGWEMKIAKVRNGAAYRLYIKIFGCWEDASLADLALGE